MFACDRLLFRMRRPRPDSYSTSFQDRRLTSSNGGAVARVLLSISLDVSHLNQL